MRNAKKEESTNSPGCFYLQGAIRHCKKIGSYLYILIYLKVRRKKMSEKDLLKGVYKLRKYHQRKYMQTQNRI